MNPILAQNEAYHFKHLTVEEGLPSNIIYNIYNDKKGFLWIGTNKGLSQYDGYQFKNFSFVEGDTSSLSGNIVTSMVEDSQGVLWLGTIGGGLNRFDPVTESFSQYKYIIKKPRSEGFDITSLIADESENLWMGTYNCGLQFFDKKTKQFSRYDLIEDIENRSDGFQKNSIHALLEQKGNKNKIWIASSEGLFLFDKKTKQIQKTPLVINGRIDTTTTIMSLSMDNPNELWVGTWRLGLGRYDIEKNIWEFSIPDEKEFYKENHHANIIDDIEKKSDDELWVASQDQGLLIWNKVEKKFFKVKNNPSDKHSILTNKINRIYKDDNQRVWFSNLQNGISYLDITNQLFKYYPLNHEKICDDIGAHVFDVSWDKNSKKLFVTTSGCQSLLIYDEQMRLIQSIAIDSEIVSSSEGFRILLSRNGSIWLARESTGKKYEYSLFKYDLTSNSLTPFSHPTLEKIPIQSYSLSDIIKDKYDNIWIATQYGGLIKIDNNTEEVKQYLNKNPQPNSIDIQTELTQLLIAENGNVWISTLQEGIFSFNPSTEKFKQFTTSTDSEKLGLKGKRVITIEEDSKELIWAGLSSTGIQIINPNEEDWMIKSYHAKNGLPSEELGEMKKDADGNIWITSQSGLIRFDESTKTFKLFNHIDGIKDVILLDKGIEISENGTIYLGQTNEICSFSSKQLAAGQVPKNIVFNSFKVFDKEISHSKDLNYIDQIDLNYDENFFTIGFAELKFGDISKINYAFKLEGYDDNWNNRDGKRNFANYTKVPPGSYTFKVRTTPIQNGISNIKEMKIVITPPFWKTWWAYLIYSFVGLLLLLSIYRFQLRKSLAKQEAERLKELNEAKTRLFNNITHELRTPLTVVLGSVDRARRLQRSLSESELKLIKQNGEHLLKLINQVLDLGKLDAGAMHLNSNWEDIVEFLNYVTASFETLADEKNINLSFQSYPPNCKAYFDKEKLSIILSNLISNALKFTPEDGSIDVFVSVKENLENKTSENELIKALIIKVQDTGIGIPKEQLPFIFDRFYQVEKELLENKEISNSIKGTGIGLSLTKELVKLMDGNIMVENNSPNAGTNFKIKIPIFIQQDISESTITGETKKLPVVLIVEDNPSLVQYISSGLNPHFQLLIENNGKDGLEKAIETVPDVIISDVVMPVMDGLALCKELRKNDLTSHIPIILLTAKVGQDAKLEGLESGADAYLTKPFDEQELLIRIQNLLKHRESLRTYYLKTSGLTADELVPTSKPKNELEEIFLKRVKTVLEEEFKNSQFSVTDLCTKIGLSQTQLNRKLVALTGQPPVKMMRSLRLNKAKKLLLDTSLTISEITYQIGFSDPSYFSKSFKSEFGISPKDFRQKMK